MNEQDFEDGLDRYGGDLTRWPADLRIDAARLLARSDAARRLLTAMQEIDAHFDATRAPVGDDGGLVVRATRRRQIAVYPRWARKVGWGTAAAVLLLTGIVLGAGDEPHDDTSRTVNKAMASLEMIDVD